MSKKYSRRMFVKISGVACTSVGATQVVGAADTTTHPTTQSEGIDAKIENLIRNNKIEQVSKILDEYGISNACTKKLVDYNSETGEAKSVTVPVQGGQTLVQPTDEWDKSSSTVSRSTYHKNSDTDLWGTSLDWELGDGGDAGEGQFEDNRPHDGIQLSFSTDDWDHKSGDAWVSPDWDSNVDCACSKGAQIDNKAGNGIGVIYDDPNNPAMEDITTTTSGSAHMSVWRQDDNRSHTLYGSYTHTWSTADVTGLNFTYDSTPIGVGVGIGSYSWEKKVDHIVKPNNEVEVDRY
ncbi:hypothetical protein [Halorussus pelagicus]|uniref:hypothetical protein n=1 Tax=Halorussus pelagicus TaxID=2505977 RepID=UPI000FFC72FE|nr:hypothetical protein [Halorussus pelagicus]